MSDVDMLRMVQQGIRGGMTAVPKRYAEANNKYMGDNYDTNKSSKYILYLDVNALYSWAMTNRLPTDGFEWMTEKELNNRNISCILEVDLDYPEELHDLHNEYPLAPENIKVGDSKIEKLVPNLRSKEKCDTQWDFRVVWQFRFKSNKDSQGYKVWTKEMVRRIYQPQHQTENCS